MPKNLIGHTFLTIPALVSSAFGVPLFVEIKSRIPERISKFLHRCLQIVPEEWFIDSSVKMPKLENFESFQGKVVVCKGEGLPVKTTEVLYQAYLNQDPPTGYVGMLLPKDPLRKRPSILVVDLDADMSALIQEFECYSGQSALWEPDIQKAFLKVGLKRLKECNGKFDTAFLEEQWAAEDDLPEKDVAMLVYRLTAKFSPEFIGFNANGMVMDPLLHGNEGTWVTNATTYSLTPLLLEKSFNRKPLTADYPPQEIFLVKALEGLHEDNPENDGFTEEIIRAETKIAQSTLYKQLAALREKGAIKVTNSRSSARLHSINHEAFEEGAHFRLPTLEDYEKNRQEPVRLMLAGITKATVLGEMASKEVGDPGVTPNGGVENGYPGSSMISVDENPSGLSTGEDAQAPADAVSPSPKGKRSRLSKEEKKRPEIQQQTEPPVPQADNQPEANPNDPPDFAEPLLGTPEGMEGISGSLHAGGVEEMAFSAALDKSFDDERIENVQDTADQAV
jgi:hypothetical protein